MWMNKIYACLNDHPTRWREKKVVDETTGIYIPNKYMLDDANNFSSFSSFSCYAKESVHREK